MVPSGAIKHMKQGVCSNLCQFIIKDLETTASAIQCRKWKDCCKFRQVQQQLVWVRTPFAYDAAKAV
jgi:hypothetical protein